MNKTCNLLGSIMLLASTSCVLTASEQTIKYDNLSHVVNPDGKTEYILTYIEKADGILDKTLTINIPKLPYKTSFNLCPKVDKTDKCKGSIFIAKEDGEYFLNYNLTFLNKIKGKKLNTRQIEGQDAVLGLNEKSDENEYYSYDTLGTTSSYWILKK